MKTAGIGGNHGRIRIILLLFCSEFVFDRELHFENKLRAINMPYVLISAQIRLVRTSLVNKIASDSALKSLELIMLFKFIYWPLFLTFTVYICVAIQAIGPTMCGDEWADPEVMKYLNAELIHTFGNNL